MSKTLIRGAKVLGGEPQDVLIDGTVVEAVGTNLSAEGAEVVEADGKVLLPGLARRLDRIPPPDEQMPLPQRIPREGFNQYSAHRAHGGLDGGHPQTLGDHRLQLVEHVELVGDGGPESRGPTSVVEGAGPAHPVVRGDEPRVLRQVGQGHLQPVRQWVIGRGGHEHRDGSDSSVVQLRRVSKRQPWVVATQGDVELAGL